MMAVHRSAVRNFAQGLARFAVVSLLFLATDLRAAPPFGAALTANSGKWLAELVGDKRGRLTAYPQSLAWQADHPAAFPAAFLVVGVRPPGDRMDDTSSIRGQKRTDADWVISDGSGAIWVTGLPAPEPGKPLVLIGQFTTDGALALRGIRFLMAAAQTGKTQARPGDYLYYPLAGNKGSTVPVDIDGDAVELAFTDERDALIVRAVRPGIAKIRFFLFGFTDDKPTLQGERLLVVE